MNAKALRLLSLIVMLVIFASALGSTAQAGGYSPTSVSIATDGNGTSVATHWIYVTVTVKHQAQMPLTGQVCFNYFLPNSTNNFSWSCKKPDTNGKATFSTDYLNAGNVVMQAKYQGDMLNQESATTSFTQHVVPITSNVSIDDPGTSNVAISLGQRSLWVMVKGINDSIQTFPGQIVLFENGQQIASASTEESDVGGAWHSIAWFTLGDNLGLSKGKHVLTAVYVSSNKNFSNSSSAPVTVTVSK